MNEFDHNLLRLAVKYLKSISQSMFIMVWVLIFICGGLLCGPVVNAESAVITFTDAVDLEARVDSIGAVCDTAIADTLCVLFDHKDKFVLAYRDSTYTCRSIEWVAVLKEAKYNAFHGQVFNMNTKISRDSTFYQSKIPGEAKVKWSEVTK